MALDTKQKRGSALDIALPHRQWLLEPDGTIAAADRLSFLKFSSAIAPGAVTSVIARVVLVPAAERVVTVPGGDR